MRTRVTDLLGIKYPIIQGGMQWLSDAPFAAGVIPCGQVVGLVDEIKSVSEVIGRSAGKAKKHTIFSALF
jgi:enoyl-[acyl-carrier protein] reductase II